MISTRFILFILVGFLISSCKDATPELTSLLSGKSASSTAPYIPKGRVTLGSKINNGVVIGASTYNVRSRVVVVPQNQAASVSVNGVTYTIRGKVGL